MRVCLFEDRGAGGLEPLTQTRPVFDLLCGASSLAAKLDRTFPTTDVGVVVRPEMAEIVRQNWPGMAVNDDDWLRSGPIVLVNGRWLPPVPAPRCPLDRPVAGRVGEQIAFAVVGPSELPSDVPEGVEDWVERCLTALPAIDAGGTVVRNLWELVEQTPNQLRQEFSGRAPPRFGPWAQTGWRPEGTSLIGPADRLLIHPTARIDPHVVFDTTDGPVTIESDAVVRPYSLLAGPCAVGPGTHVLGARLSGGVVLGPGCRVGGEVENCIVQGFTNKAHDGFLGHSYIGAWVNIGAGTQVSDLRHDYGPIAVRVRGENVSTGRTKVGCFLGDHAKVGLGCLVNSGTVAGAFSQFLPAGRLLPKDVPAFCTTAHDALAPRGDLDALLDTASHVMGRRGQSLTMAHANLYRALYAATAGDRRRALRDADLRRHRRTG